MGTPNDPRYDPRRMPTAGPDIYSALAGVSNALTSTVKLLERAVNDWERREEELRDAHLDLASALNRRMDDIAESLADNRRRCTERHTIAMRASLR